MKNFFRKYGAYAGITLIAVIALIVGAFTFGGEKLPAQTSSNVQTTTATTKSFDVPDITMPTETTSTGLLDGVDAAITLPGGDKANVTITTTKQTKVTEATAKNTTMKKPVTRTTTKKKTTTTKKADSRILYYYEDGTTGYTPKNGAKYKDPVFGDWCVYREDVVVENPGMCDDCGKKRGTGQNGTCEKYLVDTHCEYCGEFVKARECHTCKK